jgi:hypothetical protein
MTFSVMGDRRNDIVLRLRHADSRLGEDEVYSMSKSIDHVMRHVPLDRTVQSVFDELRELRAFDP